jgi:hypothetical protein
MRIAAAFGLVLLLTACTPRLAEFRRTLDARDSATLALEDWCGRQGIASPARIEATTLDDSAQSPATPAIRTALEVGPDEPVRVRHVRLSCGGAVLSDARNWYVPGRLTAEMNRTLDTTRVPFGKVVAPIGLHRRPFPRHSPSPAPCPAATILHNTAVLRRDDGQAYSLVSECYTRANLDGNHLIRG